MERRIVLQHAQNFECPNEGELQRIPVVAIPLSQATKASSQWRCNIVCSRTLQEGGRAGGKKPHTWVLISLEGVWTPKKNKPPEGEGPVPMETTPEVYRTAVRAKKQALLRDKKHVERSESWDEEFEAKVQQKIESLEAREQERLPVEAKMRLMGSKMQRLRDKRRAREGQIKGSPGQRHRLAANHQRHAKGYASCSRRVEDNALRIRCRIFRTRSRAWKTERKKSK